MNADFYTLSVAGLERQLPLVQISDDMAIASFVLLGDTELTTKAAQELVNKLPKADVVITAEAKGIPLAYEVSRLMGMKRHYIARKSIKPYMRDTLQDTVFSITTQKEQTLCLDGKDSAEIKGKNVIIIDDVISTGESLQAIERLVNKAGGNVVAKAAILAEGDAAKRDDIIFLEYLPLFPIN